MMNEMQHKITFSFSHSRKNGAKSDGANSERQSMRHFDKPHTNAHILIKFLIYFSPHSTDDDDI